MRYPGESERSIGTEGGPLVLLPRSCVTAWRGYPKDSSDPLDVSHDYGRACAIDDRLGVIRVADAQGLVLTCPDLTYVEVHPRGHQMLVRWEGSPSEEALLRAAHALDVDAPPAERVTWTVREADFELFDAVFAGSETKRDWLILHLDPGEYFVETHVHNGQGVSATVHIFKRR